jgi:long-subunit acyl-CoA synthetase (AMP-forming)
MAIVHPKKKTSEKEILSDLEKIWKQAKMNSLEKISAVVIVKEEFNEENDMATNNGKFKRNVIKEKYKKEIEEAYKG